MLLDFARKKKLKCILIVMLILAIETITSARTLIEQINWRGADTRIIIWVSIAFLILIGVLLFFYFKMRLRTHQDKRELSEAMFKEYVKKAELTPDEVLRLKQLASHNNLNDLNIIFESIAIFEICIEQEIELLKRKNLSSKDMADECNVLSNIRKKLGFNYLPYEHPIASTRNIEIGQKVTLLSGTNKSQSFRSLVIMNPEHCLRVQIEHGQEGECTFHPGQQVAIAFARQGDGLYAIDTKVESFDRDSLIVELSHTREMKRNQLRQFVRIEINLPVKVRILQAVSEDDKSLVGKQFEAKMVDISGGGISFLLNKPLVPGQLISINFQLSTASFNGQTGKILKVSLIDIKSTTMYRHHVTFLDIDTPLREKIIKFVFEKQRQLNQWR
ncbi:MAG TPA: PilZ domain-containing protein [Chitinispirillaceae bacterium]|nr:PilZ domain-containing protein [Chitinispirillaceae bacterium]